VLFRGANRSYKVPEVLRVPACTAHNEDTSGDDEVFAGVMSSFASPSVAFDVQQALMKPVIARALSDPKFADRRLKNFGSRILRSPEEYGADGFPITFVPDAEYARETELAVRSRATKVERTIRKVAAGLFFHASGRLRRLGIARTSQLRVLVPQFKEITAEHVSPFGPRITQEEFFGSIAMEQRAGEWRDIASGDPEVFEGTILMPRGHGHRLSLLMRFYRHVDVWVASPND